MVVAEERDGQLVIIDRLKEMVRLAAGLDEKNNLAPDVEQVALECLQKFGQRLREFSAEDVSAVGTNTLRRIHNAKKFLPRAEQMLGHSIEIISGIEEARLVYQGVAHGLEADSLRKLVVDIGGGSTELIIGEGLSCIMMDSLEMGCVTITRRFFADGKITDAAIQRARVYVLQKMRAIRHQFQHQGWDIAFGASGTIRETCNIVQALGLVDSEGISFESLIKLLNELKRFDTLESINIEGLSEHRVPVYLGGLIILQGVFEALDIAQMRVSDNALREGLLYDLLGRHQNRDIRNQSVQLLANRFHVDNEQAGRVESLTSNFLKQVFDTWSLKFSDSQKLISWASALHEIGRDISQRAYYKHSAYIIENTDLAGFSQQEQQRLAVLVRCHKGKLRKSAFNILNENYRMPVMKLTVLFRIAIIFHRSRVSVAMPAISLVARGRRLVIRVPAEWIDQHPLTLSDLQQEVEELKAIQFKLSIE
ncbi:MAG: Ppx/GppA family phosphatase [Gammaproteobacteria bacterium]|nr:Ppx/GppA family phosphatase [Gammaproteobacteria bacterium]